MLASRWLRLGALASVVAGVSLKTSMTPGVAAAEEGPPVGVLEGRIVSGEKLDPIEGATIVASRSEGGYLVASGTTKPDGTFSFIVRPGTYDLLAVYGDSRWVHHNTPVEVNRTTRVPGVLSVEPSEVITIHDTLKHEHRDAEVVRSTIDLRLPYSDELVDQNEWAVGWVLLDVSEQGHVTGFRYLHRPGHDLQAITEREAFKLRFKPALNDAGRPVAVKVVWKFEWPAYWWSMDHLLVGLNGLGALTPPLMSLSLARPARGAFGYGMVDAGGFFLPGQYQPPCNNEGPRNLDMSDPIYRDCSRPDFNSLASEPLVVPQAHR
jgi:hypothetical protein